MGRGNYKVGVSRTPWTRARSHAPLRPVEDVVRTSPRVPPELLVDPHAPDDLLLGVGESRVGGELGAAEAAPGAPVDAEAAVVAVGAAVDGVPAPARLA